MHIFDHNDSLPVVDPGAKDRQSVTIESRVYLLLPGLGLLGG